MSASAIPAGRDAVVGRDGMRGAEAPIAFDDSVTFWIASAVVCLFADCALADWKIFVE